MKRNRVASIVGLSLLVIAVGLAGGFGYRTLQELRAEVAGLRSSVAGLQGDLAESERRAEDARSRADTAEERADQAEDLSQRLAERARAAEQEATVAQGEARSAQSRAAASQTQAERAAAVQRQAILDATKAEQEASEAKERLAQVRAQKQRQLDRLERTLGKIAETRRTALGMVMNLGDSIEFDFDKAELRPENREILSRIAGVLLTAEDVGIQVYGHTDDVGSVEYNQELSERRAAAVRQYLVEAGVDPDIIQSKGFGKSAPLVEGTDPESRQRNRRVEIAIVQTTGALPDDFMAEQPDGSGPADGADPAVAEDGGSSPPR